MSRAAVIAGRTVADLILTLVAATVTVLARALAVGWRMHASPAHVLLALLLGIFVRLFRRMGGGVLGILARDRNRRRWWG